MRKLGTIIGVVFAIIVVGVVIFLATFDANRYRGLVQDQLQKNLGRDVKLGTLHLALFPPRLQVDSLSIADDPSFGDPNPFVQAEQLDVSVKLLPLLHHSVEVNSLDLRRPKVELIKNAQGTWNFSTLGNKSEQQSQPSQPEPSGGSKQQFALGQLTIQDGQVGLTDQQAHKPRAVYDHIDVSLNDFAPGQPFSLQVAAHLPGPGNQEVRLQGKGGPVNQGDPAATPFQGSLGLKNVAISGLKQFLQTPALENTDGTVSGQTQINSSNGKLAAQGHTDIANAKVHGVDIGYPIAADYDVGDDLRTDLLTINKGDIKLGATPLSLSGTVNSKPTPAELNVNLRANNVSIAEMAKLASAFGVAFAPGTNVNGQVNANVQARGSASKPALNGTITASNVQATGKEIAQPVQIPQATFALTPTEVHSNPFNVVSGNTTVVTTLAVRDYTSNSPFVNATLHAPNAALPNVLAMAKAYGVKGLEKISGSGTMNLDAHVAAPVQSLTGDAVMRAINGNMNLNFQNVRVAGVDVAHELAQIAGFLKPGQQDQGFTNILKMTGNIIVTNGVAQTNNLQALLDIGNVSAAGTANLVSQALNLDVSAVLAKATSQQVGGTSIGGYMNTALANNQGELVIPVLVTGTFSNPHFAPNVQKMAQMKLKGLVPSFDNPAGGASSLLGGILGKKAGAAQPNPGEQQQAQPNNAVQQIIGLFGNKKKNNNPPNPPK
jgi:AsmA protein